MRRCIDATLHPLLVESAVFVFGEACYGHRFVETLPQYPVTLWALVEQAAQRWPDHVLLADDHGRSLTGRQLQAAASAVAADLSTRGISAGTVVSWQLPTTLETMVLKVALARLGAVQNPLVPILREREVGFITRLVGTEVMITTERWRGFDHGALAAISPPGRASR